MTAAQQDSSTSPTQADDSSHAVYFYDRDDDLAEGVAAYVGKGVLAGEAAIIIAAETHRDLIIQRLHKMSVDVEAARARGDLIILDAATTLAKFMVDGAPDPDLFRRVVGSVLESASTRGNRTACRCLEEGRRKAVLVVLAQEHDR